MDEDIPEGKYDQLTAKIHFTLFKYFTEKSLIMSLLYGSNKMRLAAASVVLCVALALILATAGCTSPAGNQTPVKTPATTAVPTANATTAVPTATPTPAFNGTVFNQSFNGKNATVKLNETFRVSLEGNPTTGYLWNASVSKGLTILNPNGTYTQNPAAANMTGVGGVFTWDVKAITNGTQTFSAIYKRPWENATVNDTKFNLTLKVV
jgi:inhibitor of cysteine peptidase